MTQRAVIIGVGTISVVHITALEAMGDEVEIVGVCDTNPEHLARHEGRYPVYDDIETMLDDTKPDVAHICLPHAEHLPAIRLCLEHGVAAFTEKPVTANVAQGEELLDLVQDASLPPVGVCFQNRYNPTFLTALELTQSGVYGKVKSVRGFVPWRRDPAYYEQSPWRGKLSEAGSGVMINQAIHTLDHMQLIGGGQAVDVRGMIGQLLDYGIEVEDSVMAKMTFTNGAEGLLNATLANEVNESVELKIYLEKALVRIYQGVLTVTVYDHASGEEGMEELCRDVPFRGPKSYYGSSHGAAIRKFYRAVREGTDHYVHVADAMASIYTIDAIRTSSTRGQETVAVKQVPESMLNGAWLERHDKA